MCSTQNHTNHTTKSLHLSPCFRGDERDSKVFDELSLRRRSNFAVILLPTETAFPVCRSSTRDLRLRPPLSTLISLPWREPRSRWQTSSSTQFPTLQRAYKRPTLPDIKTNGLEWGFNFDRATRSSELRYKTNSRAVEHSLSAGVRVFTFSASRRNNSSRQ